MKLKTTLLAALLIMTCATEGLAWGQKGHDTTCEIAQRHLTRKAKKKITKLLDGKSILYWSNWLDNASNTPEYAYAKTWHYKNIDPGQTWEQGPVEPQGDIVNQLERIIRELKTLRLTREAQQLRLKMLVHLMGDLHQPMHLGHLCDLGGNRWKVVYFKNETNIHSVWDSQLVESAHKWSHTEWADEIDRENKQSVKQITEGSIESWGRETFAIATEVYAGTPEMSNLSYSYVQRWTPIVEQQFVRGGLRLAHVLNDIFK